MNTTLIKVGFLVSYDWYLLENALPLVYSEADIIYLALDKKRFTWAGNKFDFDDEAFYKMIDNIDINKKIKIYEDDFFVENLTPMQCEVRERNLLAKQMGEGGWHIQLDADEYFLDFQGFVKYLKKMSLNQKEINICASLINLFKKTEDGYLYVINRHPDWIQIATNKPHYEYGRRNGYFNHISPFYLLHDSWSRPEQEIWQKISNWGHRDDFDKEKYFSFWKKIDASNYHNVKDFHFLLPQSWKNLEYCEGETINAFLQNFVIPSFPISKFQRIIRNNRNVARLKHLFNRIIE